VPAAARRVLHCGLPVSLQLLYAPSSLTSWLLGTPCILGVSHSLLSRKLVPHRESFTWFHVARALHDDVLYRDDIRRFYLEVAATGRFRVVREWELDGYRMAVPERLQDAPPPEPSAQASEELAELAKAVEADADAWIARLGCGARPDG
jgi:hypothetical protein